MEIDINSQLVTSFFIKVLSISTESFHGNTGSHDDWKKNTKIIKNATDPFLNT